MLAEEGKGWIFDVEWKGACLLDSHHCDSFITICLKRQSDKQQFLARTV